MQANLMGDAEASELAWGETYFSDCFDQVGKVITWVSRKQKSTRVFVCGTSICVLTTHSQMMKII
jgi:hypothetical protein